MYIHEKSKHSRKRKQKWFFFINRNSSREKKLVRIHLIAKTMNFLGPIDGAYKRGKNIELRSKIEGKRNVFILVYV